ncbi:MAG: FAD-dependent oxidoreductase [Steroidobacteraceae bacterium]
MTGSRPDTEPLDPADPWARQEQTFPKLSEEMISAVRAFGQEEAPAPGTALFERGQRSADFFLVLQGNIEIFELDLAGVPHLLRLIEAGQFTGELYLLNERQALVTARAGLATRVLRVHRADFRRLLASEPDVAEILMRAFILRRVGYILHGTAGVELAGPGNSGDTLRIQQFMQRNGYPYRLLDTESDADAAGFLSCFGLSEDQLPVVVLPGKVILRNPGNGELADALGLIEALDPDKVYDVAVIGGGPAGLAAAVYAASEGLSTIVFESIAPGGQAGTSSKIENYLGFPTGISGQALAGRAQNQAQKFGARLAIARTVTGLDCAARPYRLAIDGRDAVRARSIVVASGARYRKLEVETYSRFEGHGIHYAATAMEARLCDGQEVAVVGGGNSAGQAAVFLARGSRHVHVIVRGSGLATTMSDYLVQRIAGSPKITVHPYSQITRLEGDRLLREVGWTDRRTGATETRAISNLFVMIGAEPNTEWLGGCLALDMRGFIRTGSDAEGRALSSPFVTSRPGIFAVGDVRSGSVKRVASGVGEGSVVVQAIHQYLNPGVA